MASPRPVLNYRTHKKAGAASAAPARFCFVLLPPPLRAGAGAGFLWGRDLFEGSFEKDPSSSPKTPQQKGLLPSEGSANNALPLFVRRRGVFAHRYCNTDFGLCLARSWTSSKPRPTGCWRTVATPHPPHYLQPVILSEVEVLERE